MKRNPAAERLKETAAASAGAVKRYAEHIAAVVKARREIYSEQDKIRRAEDLLGEMYYQDYASGTRRNDGAYRRICADIAGSREKIEAQRQLLEGLRSARNREAAVSRDAFAAAYAEAKNGSGKDL